MKRREAVTIRKVKEKLAVLDKAAYVSGWSKNHIQKRRILVAELWKLIMVEEQSWKQKSKVKWLIEGDRNTKFFYSVGVSWRRHKIHGLPLKKLPVQESASLEADFSLEKVCVALASCDGNKAPGPDGFNLRFIKDYWDLIQDDFMKFIGDFYSDGAIVNELNKTFIALIPKKVRLEVMTYFRPISLVNSMYKIIAKVVPNRMKKEIIHQWKKDGKGGIIVKLDFDKAYDSLDHNFLDDMLDEMGFGWNWRQWIMHCISSPAISVLVNGSPTREFGLERGLRPGDPLSHLLFNVLVEGLSALIKKMIHMDLLRGTVLRSGEIYVSNLQFADDTILFLQPEVQYLKNARSVLSKKKGLLVKWEWRFGMEENTLWMRVVCVKYEVPIESMRWD
ncbi:hypothetical protein Ddye_013968 [Dipteronia dyeriana]|uniref:Reverse transcriptase domain-containing protein n=1 Tax=Dipteronia dyeriana TaxID=168575 RepID=A0AAD9X7C6_9ROSI|nr:hypothetical protein Ddye_013968 [Dipteronia dyeriana]